MKQKNTRSLGAIADNIHKLSRKNIIDIGDLLLEAKAQCEHGDWLNWLDTEFDWSVYSAERYMKVAQLNAKFHNLRNLRLGATTLYQLADHDDEEELAAVIEELAKHATNTRLRPRDAERVIKVGIGRRRFGDHPDATLVQLVELDGFSDETWYEKAVAALRDRKPETDESATSIVDEIEAAQIDLEREEQRLRNQKRYEEIDDVEAILDGPPPVLPSPTTPPEPQRLEADTDWAEIKPFVAAVKDLLPLCAKPAARFIGMFPSTSLRAVSAFLMAVAAAELGAKAPEIPSSAPASSETNISGYPELPPFLDRRHEIVAKAEAT
jgi:hypothetical protein